MNVDQNASSSHSIERPDGSNTEVQLNEVEKKNKAKNGTKNKTIKSAEKEPTQVEEEESAEAPISQPVGYYLKHRINEKLIKGLVENHRFNDSLLEARIIKKEDIGGNFEIPCNMGGLKYLNFMPLSTYEKLTNKNPAVTDIRLSLASHSYIHPLGIADDVLVDVADHVYPMDFVILNIREDEKRPFILGIPFLTIAKAVIKFDKGTISLRSGKSKISFHRIPEPNCKIEKGIKNEIEPIAPTMSVNRLVLEWEEKIKLHKEKEMKFDQWTCKIFNNECPASIKEECEAKNKGEFTLYLMRSSLEVLRKFH
ncbi:MAK10-like protein [Tanacetum coccineum]